MSAAKESAKKVGEYTVAGGSLVTLMLVLQQMGMIPNTNDESRRQIELALTEKIETKQAIQELKGEFARLNTNVERLAGDHFSQKDFERWVNRARGENRAAGHNVIFPEVDK